MSLVAVFDIGGTLRAPYLPNLPRRVKERSYYVLKELYKELSGSPRWRVVVLTASPHTQKEVEADLTKLGLPQPDELVVVPGSKRQALDRIKPHLFIDNSPDHLAEARDQGCYRLLVT